MLVLCESFTNGFCYDRSYLAAFGFGDDDFKQVYACIDGILLRPDYIDKYQELNDEEKQNFHFGEHCYMERVKKDGTIWVYDPSHGLVYRKDIFDEIQHPRVIKVKFKKDVINSKEYQDIKNEDIEHSKYTLPVWIPKIETCLLVGQNFHMEALCEELELFKKEIDYYGLCREIHNDLKSLGLCS